MRLDFAKSIIFYIIDLNLKLNSVAPCTIQAFREKAGSPSQEARFVEPRRSAASAFA